MGTSESPGSLFKNEDFEALALGILIKKAWSQGLGICIFTGWGWKPILNWAFEDTWKHRHALYFKVLLDFGFQQFGRLDSLKTFLYGIFTCRWKIQRALFACIAELWETEEKSQGLKMMTSEQPWRCYSLGRICWVLLAVPAGSACVCARAHTHTHTHTHTPTKGCLPCRDNREICHSWSVL